ncbi:FAD-dependent oxidoreductase [Endozoicomonas sp. SM1973]|uniref:FAD-dependent oxidoreductase n=1 Tax=Spartinivicinus marinus TaxID=2994442 RepID=A0A853I4A3_9GAMM|nr:FAD-dependent oxidoreductase [Spartinivicinus marinus]MCX4027466.1 FAD-dependent oxidoreductase [Spartinivicinus marinus]NYZ66362.1 FAD-dependent oxidoreductase [Spartinivicinus marinus]
MPAKQMTLSSLTKLLTARLACCVKVLGDITIELGVAKLLPKNTEAFDYKQLPKYHQGIHIVVIGTGIAGLSAVNQQRNCKVAVVVGTGPLGLEIADSLYSMGIKVIILERSNQLMKHHLDRTAAIVLALQLRKSRLNLLFNSKLERCIGNENVEAIKLNNGRQLKCDLLILATGNQPNIELAAAANLKTNKGVVVNRWLQTSNPDIYAIGDLAELENTLRVDELWSVAEKQGSLVANNVLGKIESYQPLAKILQLKLAETDLLVVGQLTKNGCQSPSIVLLNNKNYQYRKLIINEGRVVGAILIGHPELKPLVLAVINQKLNVTSILANLRKGHWIASLDSLLLSNDFKISYTG